MKSYNVNEIADMLKTNPETVRRWIRLGKLKATQVSRKGGNEVTERSLYEFLASAPKYAKIAGGIAITGSLLFTGLPIGLTISLLNLINNEMRINQLQIPFSEIEKCIEENINNSVKAITKKKEEIKNIQQEISDEENKIAELKKFLEKIRSQNDDLKLK